MRKNATHTKATTDRCPWQTFPVEFANLLWICYSTGSWGFDGGKENEGAMLLCVGHPTQAESHLGLCTRPMLSDHSPAQPITGTAPPALPCPHLRKATPGSHLETSTLNMAFLSVHPLGHAVSPRTHGGPRLKLPAVSLESWFPSAHLGGMIHYPQAPIKFPCTTSGGQSLSDPKGACILVFPFFS